MNGCAVAVVNAEAVKSSGTLLRVPLHIGPEEGTVLGRPAIVPGIGELICVFIFFS